VHQETKTPASQRQLGERRAYVFRNGLPVAVTAHTATRDEIAGGVEDIEGLCWKAARLYLQKHGITLPKEDRDELISFLIGASWLEVRRYNLALESQGLRTANLVSYLGQRLTWRCSDWMKAYAARPKHAPDDELIEDTSNETSEIIDRVDAEQILSVSLAGMSKESAWTMRRVALPLSDGDTMAVIAAREGRTPKSLRTALDELAVEIERLMAGAAA
jgi:hypothetical protein